MKTFRICLFMALMLLVISACAPEAPTYTCKRDEIVYQRDVLALKDLVTTEGYLSGNIFVIRGFFTDGVGAIKYREALPSGGDITKTVGESLAIVFEDSEDNKGIVIKRSVYCGQGNIGRTEEYTNGCLEACGYDPNSVTDITWYEFHIPKGSSISTYERNLE